MFPQYLQALDQPSVDGFNSYCVAKLAHEHGQKVVLSGLGADEIFGGYPSFDKIPKLMRLGKLARFAKPLINAGNSSFHKFCTPRIRRVMDFCAEPDSVETAYASVRGIFSRQETVALMQHYLPGWEPVPAHRQAEEQPSLADTISALELSRYMRNQLLRDSDVMSMAFGLELRVPFVDSQLLQSVADIPSPVRVQRGKQLLVDALPAIPAWVGSQPKRGFSFPFDEWFGGNSTDEMSARWRDTKYDKHHTRMAQAATVVPALVVDCPGPLSGET